MSTGLGDLLQLIERGRQFRNAGRWGDAIACYAAANELNSARYDIKHNLALSLVAANRPDDAMRFLDHALALKPDLWPSHVLKAKVLRGRGCAEEADAVLSHILAHDRMNGHALLAAADLDMNEFGDAVAARARVAPLLNDPAFRADAELTTLMSKLYDRDESDEELSRQLMDFAGRELCLPGFAFTAEALAGVPKHTGRRRVGLMSPMFCLSPVYFLTFAAFSALAEQVDFILLNRGSKDDSGTAAFRGIAAEWHDVQHLEAAELANAIKRQSLDILFDLGGWSDPIGLKALSTKPASRLYKWVGGQSATTGLTTFDGFLTDRLQSPAAAEALHTEPLLRCEGSYVAYSPPPYMPTPRANRTIDLAIVANPAKISCAMAEHMGRTHTAPVTLIDSRFRHAKTRQNLQRRLPRIHAFIAPKSHAEFLEGLATCRRVMDTGPYCMGLTACEAITAGVTIIPSTIQSNMISSRHCISHNTFNKDLATVHITQYVARLILQD
jgi:predicted O-linked N-acetylglucosamine transferase (SPINDLY family)